MSFYERRAYALVNLSNIKHNISLIRKHINKDTKLMAVIKADAYGHGACEVATAVLEAGANYLAVACMAEAQELRENNILAPILVLSHFEPKEVLKYNVIPAIYNIEEAIKLNEIFKINNKKVVVHIKLDTGMTRLGFSPQNLLDIVEISKMSNIIIEGIFSHFSVSDDLNEKDYTQYQFDKFQSMVKELAKMGVEIPIKHICNSAGTILNKEMHLDMVRCGIILYTADLIGYESKEFSNLKTALSLKAKITQLREIKKGTTVSYGRTFTAEKDMKIAVMSIGYADGFSRALSNDFYVLLNGKKAPIIGRICMDQSIIDVTDIPNVETNQIATIIGDDGDFSISAADIATRLNTINYEVLCNISKRVPRIYLKE